MNFSDAFQLVAALGASGVVSAGILYGLSNWLGTLWLKRIMAKEQAKIDLKVIEFNKEKDSALEEIRHKLGRTNFAFTRQYEKEFKVYEELWEKVVDLYSATLSLRPMMDNYSDGESEEDRITKRRTRYSEAAVLTKKIILYHRPFYAEAIFKIAQELSLKCGYESIGFAMGKGHRMGFDYYKEGEKNGAEIIRLADALCVTIRERISDVEAHSFDGERP